MTIRDGISGVQRTRPKSDVAAVVVAFYPMARQIRDLVSVLAQECHVVYVMDNGGGRDALTDAIIDLAAVYIVDMGGNRGIGDALNRGFQMAKAAGTKYVATFDQDSEPPPGLTVDLINATERLLSGNAQVAAVGPRIVDVRPAGSFEYPFRRRRLGWPVDVKCTRTSEFVEVDFLITSGSVISLAAYEAVGPFDRDFFIDSVDMEWGFRARAYGYRLYGVCSAAMSHELGTGDSVSAFGLTILGHSPVRRYYYARNTVRMLRLSHVGLGWKIRMLLGLIARILILPVAINFSAGWKKHWLMLARGALDGIAGIGGACTYDIS